MDSPLPSHKPKRWHGFEFNGSPWCPAFIRDSIVSILGKSLRSSDLYDELIPLFSHFCQQAGITTLVDLASGSGDSMAILQDGMKKKRYPLPNVYLSDLLPNALAMAQAIGTRQYMEIISNKVDINHLPILPEHQGYSIISAFHHLRPHVAQSLFKHCVADNKALVIIEPFPRKIRCFFPLFLYGTAHLALNPFLTNQHRLLKAIFTYIIPVIPITLLWDGLISVQRIYQKEDLICLAAPYDELFHWQYQKAKAPLGGTVTIFTGIPKTEPST